MLLCWNALDIQDMSNWEITSGRGVKYFIERSVGISSWKPCVTAAAYASFQRPTARNASAAGVFAPLQEPILRWYIFLSLRWDRKRPLSEWVNEWLPHYPKQSESAYLRVAFWQPHWQTTYQKSWISTYLLLQRNIVRVSGRPFAARSTYVCLFRHDCNISSSLSSHLNHLYLLQLLSILLVYYYY